VRAGSTTPELATAAPDTAAPEILLSVRGLSTVYPGTRALNNVDLDVRRGRGVNSITGVSIGYQCLNAINLGFGSTACLPVNSMRIQGLLTRCSQMSRPVEQRVDRFTRLERAPAGG
jgi:hypothetical protein